MTYRVDRIESGDVTWSLTTNNRDYAWHWAKRRGRWVVYRDGIEAWRSFAQLALF